MTTQTGFTTIPPQFDLAIAIQKQLALPQDKRDRVTLSYITEAFKQLPSQIRPFFRADVRKLRCEPSPLPHNKKILDLVQQNFNTSQQVNNPPPPSVPLTTTPPASLGAPPPPRVTSNENLTSAEAEYLDGYIFLLETGQQKVTQDHLRYMRQNFEILPAEDQRALEDKVERLEQLYPHWKITYRAKENCL